MPYLDHAATTPLRAEALDAMLPYLREHHGNPSSLHGAGRRARVAVEKARARVAGVLGCEPGEVVFTSGGTEADNLALRGVLTGAALRETGRAANRRGGLVTSATEHEAVLRTAEALAAEGYPVTVLPPDGAGRLTAEAVADALTEQTGLVSAMLVNNETGAVNPVADIARVAERGGAATHTDAVQAAGLLPLDVDALGVDLLSLSGHKVGGPKGVGALYVRAGTSFGAVQTGGAQERGRRGGTENVAAMVGFAEALALADAERVDHAVGVGALRDRLRARVVAVFGDGVVVNTPSGAAPHVLSVSFPPRPGAGRGALDGEMLLTALDLEGVAASAGSACTSGALEPSHVLLAQGLDRATAAATVRFSLGRGTTEADVDAAAAALVRVVARQGGAG
ncbi:cysteine desulfurase family protein [Rubrivirga sp. S365]|uniref:cysteine desulfurase family protein n=1 Tax=Rubrivirga sp. S365 TaxID=3076080 RepID=UPI0028C932A7|nr:cysteine desulfurase family protein [Rubrivirga sp. S365]MDT7856383.1 cysteine desulfurase family protein [Rubrivirga sp. S365]